VLKKLLNQKGVSQLEIIVVDSGSSDDTLKIATKYGAKIFHIDSKAFNHGAVRNLGASKATGDYLIFLSQDVIPIGDSLIYEILKVMERDRKIAGATVKQVPRSDADLFACWQLWHHFNKFIKIPGNLAVQASKKNFIYCNPTELRKMAQLDNVFSCVRKDIFNEFLFKELRYAEDLDLGLRLFQKGYKLAFLFSYGVIHSHNRSPDYFFKRSYVDWRSLIHLLNYETRAWNKLGIASIQDMLSLIYCFYCLINISINEIKKKGFPQQAEAFFNELRVVIHKARLSYSETSSEKSLDKILKELAPYTYPATFRQHKVHNMLKYQYMDFMNSFEEFTSAYKDITVKKDELIAALYKFFALVAGTNLADFIDQAEKSGNSKSQISLINEILGQDI
jgi:glycosyltransferase involved in cell wall biosynthesis